MANMLILAGLGKRYRTLYKKRFQREDGSRKMSAEPVEFNTAPAINLEPPRCGGPLPSPHLGRYARQERPQHAVIRRPIPGEIRFHGRPLDDSLFHQYTVKYQFAEKRQALANLAHDRQGYRSLVLTANDRLRHAIAKRGTFQCAVSTPLQQGVERNT